MEIKLPVVHLPPLRVGLLWHSVNSDNLGVTALTAANIDIVSENARQLHREVQFVVLGWADAGKQQISAENIEVFAMRAKDFINPQGLYAQVRRCNIVLDISAGDSFADIYGARRFLFNVIAKSVVVLARRPLVMSPQTLGPFQRWWAKIAARFFLPGRWDLHETQAFTPPWGISGEPETALWCCAPSHRTSGAHG